jgi:adenosyl cobinamide kinase/adenosyl cobinamide phosphate guanylyltransferase
MLTVLLGGVRSGKSALALELARRAGSAVTYVATCPRLDGDVELSARIARHRAERPDSWVTIEEEVDVAGALAQVPTPTVILDCLTTWVSNVLLRGLAPDAVLAATEDALATIRRRHLDVIAVTNEVGSGIIPADPLSRTYGDLLGRVNQRWSGAADRALLLVAGRAVALHDPAELV